MIEAALSKKIIALKAINNLRICSQNSDILIVQTAYSVSTKEDYTIIFRGKANKTGVMHPEFVGRWFRQEFGGHVHELEGWSTFTDLSLKPQLQQGPLIRRPNSLVIPMSALFDNY